MNKTLTANIGGVVFHIEVDAYEKLQKYLNAISRYFSHSEGQEEIMADIESRIAELFKERLKHEQQVITEVEVDEIIAIMGEPEQYADEDLDAGQEQQRTAKDSATKRSRRIFRDPDDRILAGVCSGIGHYSGISPGWIRLLFLLAFFGWGTGILIYIILWVIIPEAGTTAEKLEMKGEPVNIDNIGKTIDEGISRVKEKIDDFTDKDGAKKMANSVSTGIDRFIEVVLTILRAFFKVLGKVLGIAFILAGIGLIAFLIGSVINSSFILSFTSEGFQYYSLQQLFSYVSGNPDHWDSGRDSGLSAGWHSFAAIGIRRGPLAF